MVQEENEFRVEENEVETIFKNYETIFVKKQIWLRRRYKNQEYYEKWNFEKEDYVSTFKM